MFYRKVLQMPIVTHHSGSWFNLLTLLIVGWCSLFALPKLYLNNQVRLKKRRQYGNSKIFSAILIPIRPCDFDFLRSLWTRLWAWWWARWKASRALLASLKIRYSEYPKPEPTMKFKWPVPTERSRGVCIVLQAEKDFKTMTSFRWMQLFQSGRWKKSKRKK